jgi:phosphatidylglycerophosphate synthase
MSDGATAEKLPESTRFVDLSDYARPLAVAIARGLRDTPVRAPHVTVVFGLVGVAGALAYARGGYPAILAGAAALQVKNVLDAVDGSLARLQNRPSRIGRFLDSITDAAVAAAVFTALGLVVARARPMSYALALAGATLVLGLLQASVYNFYYVRYRTRAGGDTTSRLDEDVGLDDRAVYEGRPAALALLRALVVLYDVIYAWQDRLVQRLDRWAAAPLWAVPDREDAASGGVDDVRDARRFLTAVSALGPGFQILVLDLFSVAAFRSPALVIEAFLWTVAVAGTLYTAALFVHLRRAAVRRARTA